MSVNTILLDLCVDSSVFQTQKDKNEVLDTAEGILKNHLPDLAHVLSCTLVDGMMRFYKIKEKVLVSFRMYRSGFITINIEFYTEENEEPFISFNCSKLLEQKLKSGLNSPRSRLLPFIKRGATFEIYYTTSDERLIEYDFDKMVFEEQSPYQKVQIVHSKTLGNMLILDDLQNIAESDLIYTETLMSKHKENYKDKDIVILGGGDGALLYELLKQKPKNIIMLEIDETVMKACSKYMRSICGDVLDTYQGKNYQIIVGDCMKTLDTYIDEEKKFDYVFADLTDVPISEEPSSELWTFINLILQKSFKVLKPTGKFMTHIIGSVMKDTIKQYQECLDNLDPPVTYTMSNAFVPSFVELWEFCQVRFKSDEKNE
ncbi:unnamed protein product [Brassicogethes aeneus]|uniref:PABS domain-containing protein n=1 Tax=Brassicogethes aeneus TaxID=1431903 RepID=A0A9P0ARS8_BRAAE|nr:unnamed protein product [Brassicogethes aeneus]